MLSPEAVARRNAQRKALAAYLAGSREHPHEIAMDPDFCVCAVLSPSWLSHARFALRAAATRIAELMPLSPLKVFFYRLLGVRIGRGVFISPRVVLDPGYPSLIELDDGCLLGMGCRLFTHEYTPAKFRLGRIRVGKGAVIGAYSTVRSGVTIGEKATVGFNSYVHGDVPAGQTVGGVPARPLHAEREGG